jgi:hypothetical protein
MRPGVVAQAGIEPEASTAMAVRRVIHRTLYRLHAADRQMGSAARMTGYEDVNDAVRENFEGLADQDGSRRERMQLTVSRHFDNVPLWPRLKCPLF